MIFYNYEQDLYYYIVKDIITKDRHIKVLQK